MKRFMHLAVPVGAVCTSSLAWTATPPLVLQPLEQHRRLTLTLHARSGETESITELSSAPEAFEPFYAGIRGELIIETATAAGLGGHFSEINPDGFVIAHSCSATVTTRGDMDAAASQTHAFFSVRFQIPQDAPFEVIGYANSQTGTPTDVELSLVSADGKLVWELQPNRPESGFVGAGVLEAGEYTMVASTLVRVEVDAHDADEARASLITSFHLGERVGCPCDWNEDGLLDTTDLFAFLHDFFANRADYNGSGETDSADFFAFVTCMLLGCGA